MRRLRKSLKEHGLVGHLVWNKANGHVIGGHQRLEALDSLMKAEDYELEVLMVDIPDRKQELKLNVALNNQDLMGTFNYEMLDSLAVEFGFDPVEDFGFSEELVETVFPEVEQVEEARAYEEAEASGGEIEPPAPRTASAEDIALMKEKKHEGREKMKALREEMGDYSTEAKGVLTLVFPKESQKRQWMEAKGLDPERNVLHVNEMLKALGLPEEEFEGVDLYDRKWKEAREEAREAEEADGEEGQEPSGEASADE